jgi:protein SCO1/2
MTATPGGPSSAVAALLAIVAVTAAWWALALWPVEASGPEWILRTREVCFGSTADTLPGPGGWVLLVGQPAGMLILLAAGWGTELRDGLARLTRQRAGQLIAGAVLAVVMLGFAGVVVRVRTAGLDGAALSEAEAFETGARAGGPLTRLNDAAPAFRLVDQNGVELTLDAFRGRPVLVTFAYAHCATVCPAIVAEVAKAREALGEAAPDALILTLDPWRDPPARLPSIATQWRLDDGAHVLSGPPEVVERALNAWRVPRVRNEKTGDISHPTIVYVVDGDGRIRYAVSGVADVIAAAVRAL